MNGGPVLARGGSHGACSGRVIVTAFVGHVYGTGNPNSFGRPCGLVPLSPADVHALDINAAALGVPTSDLMAAAGAAVAREVALRWPAGKVLVLAGLGNNGGDGLVAAADLHATGHEVVVLLAGDASRIRSTIAREALEAAVAAGVPVYDCSQQDVGSRCAQAAIIVDAMLGVGATGTLRDPMAQLVQAARESKRPVLAVDLPTGHGSADVLRATCTVTFHDQKADMDAVSCGDIVVADIGIPSDAERFVGPGDLMVRYPKTPKSAHKGAMGRPLIVGGGPYTGAPTLAALGALATGTDLLYIAAPGYAAEVAMNRALEAIVHPLPGQRFTLNHVSHIESWWDPIGVVLIGPGLGRHEETVAAVRVLVERAIEEGKRVVLDADALYAFAGHDGALRDAPVVLTPHAAEFRTLTGIDVRDAPADARIEAVQGWLAGGKAVVLLKGPEDVIVAHNEAVRNRVHHPAMTTGGTGDVLAGCVAALAGRGATPFDAARLAAYWVGAAGVDAAQVGGYALRASDLPVYMPGVLKRHLDGDIGTGMYQ